MSELIIAYDLGTGGVKSSLIEVSGKILASSFSPYNTVYPYDKYHDQKPEDWWDGIVKSTKTLLETAKVDVNRISCLAISGHSLGVIPIDKDGKLLREYTPIWSDTRAFEQRKKFFEQTDYNTWYTTTGNGFPAECYSIFKLMWYKDNEPDMYNKIYKVLGTKDYCNFKLTGNIYTDHSYASGTGVYDLVGRKYCDEYIDISATKQSFMPEILSSHEVVGTITKQASIQTGLPQHIKVVCGGVDNSCMALGARGIENGRIYTSLGSSSWIALISDKPILDVKYKPFVFAHVIDGMYDSATSIFSAGSSLRWVRDAFCNDLMQKEAAGGQDAYIEMNKLASQSPIGANKLIFNPTLAGGSMLDETPDIRGGYMGLTLRHTRSDVIRSAMEGISLNLRYALDILRAYEDTTGEMLMVGGGSKSPLWRYMFANIYGMDIVKTNIDQEAASIGAAAIAAYGTGLWKDYKKIDEIHKVEEIEKPNKQDMQTYNKVYDVFKSISHFMARAGVMLNELDI
jgi:xylulokinase